MNQSPLLTVHEAAGARLQSGEAPRVLTYGDVPSEYEAATTGCALFDETTRGLIRATGAEAAAFLHRLLANDVNRVEPGGGNRTLLLSPKGKILFDFDLAVSEDAIELSTPAGEETKLLTALDLYLFADQVELTNASEEHAPLALVGPEAEALIDSLLIGELPELGAGQPWAQLEFDGVPVRVTRLEVAGSPGFQLDGGPETALALWPALIKAGAVPAGIVTRDILRIERGAALPGEDIDENIYPQEANLDTAFSLDKGCYIGQEVVAKIDTYGGLNKRLITLKIEHDDPIPRGAKVILTENGEDRELGIVTSWSYSFVLDTGLVLAYIKKRHQEVGSEFQIAGAKATIVESPVR